MRFGIGYDVHRLVRGRRLVLGGVTIPHSKGLSGHSDADVLAHAITDALLGAAGLGDIGLHFPDSDPAYKGADSIALLRTAYEKVKANGFVVNNLDAVIIAEEPKLYPFTPEMKTRIAEALTADPGTVNIKATTTEGLGFTGRKRGIAAWAVISILPAAKRGKGPAGGGR
jgi:2-C-methyl-D-erythritol 2,4-cyclodiphosphate synthase